MREKDQMLHFRVSKAEMDMPTLGMLSKKQVLMEL